MGNAQYQQFKVAGLYHIVVGAGLVSTQQLVVAIQRGKHNHRCVLRCLVGAQLAYNLKAVYIGQHHIAQNQTWLLLADIAQRLLSLGVADGTEIAPHTLTNLVEHVGIVLDDSHGIVLVKGHGCQLTDMVGRRLGFVLGVHGGTAGIVVGTVNISSGGDGNDETRATFGSNALVG